MDARTSRFRSALYSETEKKISEINACNAVVSLDFLAFVLQIVQSDYSFSACPLLLISKDEYIFDSTDSVSIGQERMISLILSRKDLGTIVN